MIAVKQLCLLVAVATVVVASAAAQQPGYREGEILIWLNPIAVSRLHLTDDRVVGEIFRGATVIEHFTSVPGAVRVRLRGTTTRAAVDAFQNGRLRFRGRVINGRPSLVKVVEANATIEGVSDDPCYPEQWDLNDPTPPSADINAPEAWPITEGDPDAVIGVIDTGVDSTHPDLSGAIIQNSCECGGVDNFDDDHNGFKDDCVGFNAVQRRGSALDDSAEGHGTRVAGIIAARRGNGIGISGVAPKTRILVCKALDKGSQGTVADAIKCLDYMLWYATSRGTVVATNNSYGGTIESAIFQAAIETQAVMDILFIAAAGNDGRNLDTTKFFPASYATSNLIAVGSSMRDGQRTCSSNFGKKTVHLLAPGYRIVSTDVAPVLSCASEQDNHYSSRSGTSYAAPHVAGVAALLKGYYKFANADEIKRRIVECGTPDNSCTISQSRVNALKALICE